MTNEARSPKRWLIGEPLLGSVPARDKYAPRSLQTRDERRVYSDGVLVLGLMATVLLIVFRASLTQLIQLYLIGVFVIFSLGQSGMVVHWIRFIRSGASPRGPIIRSLSINSLGLCPPGLFS